MNHGVSAQSDAALFDLIISRRSATTLGAPGPSAADLERILAAAVTVPDHGQLRPFRFVVVSGDGRLAFGAALATAALAHKPQLTEQALEATRAKALRSPTLVVLIASPKPGKIEVWEQTASAACTGYAILLASHALGIGAVWKNVAFRRGPGLDELLGLGPAEEMLGWIHLGTSSKDNLPARPPVDVGALTTVIDRIVP